MFRFTIRELVLVTAVIALGAGWWADHRRQNAATRAAHWYYTYSSNILDSLGYQQVFKNGRIAEIKPPSGQFDPGHAAAIR